MDTQLTPSAKACRTSNSKLSEGRHAYATMTSQASCPLSCPLLGNGCYAESGPQGIHTARLSRSEVVSPEQIAEQEAAAIDLLPTDMQASLLRLHVVGDSKTNPAARTVAAAARRWAKRCQSVAYGYTHAWREVLRSSWRGVSVLASVENMADAAKAWARGYAPALIVSDHKEKRATLVDGFRVIPCPNQTTGVTCDKCRLCFDADSLHKRRAVISFAAHGVRVKRIRETVTTC